MERYEIETFLALAEELHFARTATRLGVSPGRVSQTIKKVERRIGGPLFDRTSRRVTLTPLGRRFNDDLRPAYHQVERAVARATETARGVTGILRVGFSAAWCGTAVVRAADLFWDRHPDCAVEIRETRFLTSTEDLLRGEIDVQLAELPAATPDIATGPVVFSLPRALAVPAGHPLAGQRTVSLEDLARIPLIVPSGLTPAWREHHFPLRTPEGRPVMHGPEAVAWQEMLSLVGAGKGAAPTSAMSAGFYFRPDVVYVPFDEAPPVEYAPQWTAGRETAAVRAFVDTILEVTRPGG